MRFTKIVVLVSIAFIMLSGCYDDKPTDKVIAPFSFVNQNGEEFGTKELYGSIWIANFMFTNCTSVCPMTSMEMAQIQKVLSKKGIEVVLVSFTVDPEVDSPERLKQYVNYFTDDDSNWHFLTGYTQEEIERFANEQFETIVQKTENSDQIIHGSSFYLIDQEGKIINKFHYSNNSYLEEMLEQIENLY